MNRKSIILIIPCFLALFIITCSSKSPSEPELTFSEKLQKALDNGVVSSGGKGASVAFIMPDGERWIGVSGVSHEDIEITPEMRFSAGSIAKNFSAATILKLAEQGEINLDDQLYYWVPAFPYVDSTITIRQLLNHTSGLYDVVDNPDFWEEIFQNPAQFWTPEELIIMFNQESLFPKGTDWNYSSLPGYGILRIIIEDITGSDITEVYDDLFFTPFGLDQTFATKGELQPVNIAHSWYDLNGNGIYDDFYSWPRTAIASGAGGEVFSTAEDLAEWARVLYRERSVLGEEYMDQMLTFHSPCTDEEFLCEGYGLGVVKYNSEVFNGLTIIGHSGNAPGYAASCMYLTDYDVCIGFLDNTEEGNAMWTLLELFDIIIDHLE